MSNRNFINIFFSFSYLISGKTKFHSIEHLYNATVERNPFPNVSILRLRNKFLKIPIILRKRNALNIVLLVLLDLLV